MTKPKMTKRIQTTNTSNSLSMLPAPMVSFKETLILIQHSWKQVQVLIWAILAMISTYSNYNIHGSKSMIMFALSFPLGFCWWISLVHDQFSTMIYDFMHSGFSKAHNSLVHAWVVFI